MAALLSLTLATLLFSANAVSANGKSRSISLSSRKASKSVRLGNRAVSPATVSLIDQFQGTDLEWWGHIAVGTPTQYVHLVFDTGSVGLAITSTQCTSTCRNQLLYDVNGSSTYVNGGQESTISFSYGLGAGVTPITAPLTDEYALLSGTDTVSIGDVTATDTALSTITSQSPNFVDVPYSGFMGLAPGIQGFFASMVSQGLPALFSTYYTPHTAENSELTFGGIDTTKFTGDLTYAPVPPDNGGVWELFSPAIYVNGKTSSELTKNRTMIFDSAVSNVLFPNETAKAIYKLISHEIKYNDNVPGTYGIACSKIASIPAVIDIEFTSSTGQSFNLTIPSSELSVGRFSEDRKRCQTLINDQKGLPKLWDNPVGVLGGSLLKHYYTVWDMEAPQMGFAPNGY